ncbi:MAG: prolipoprotein diacylglyceryl transferase [Clostridiales bacterium]|nr:prolipoprotein diacylglyceryl transferase [Clostridiales bacterium]
MQPISFPGLGITFTINKEAFSILGWPVYWYAIFLAFGFCLGGVLAYRNAKKFGIKSNDLTDLFLILVPVSIVGARLYYVIFTWSMYKDNLLEIFNIRHGGLAIYGGVISALITAFIFARKRKINLLDLLDLLAPYLALGQAIGRWGNFFNQEAYGAATNLPWRMQIYDQNSMSYISVHPTFLYESLWNFALFAFLIWFRKSRKLSGEVLTLYLAIYGLGRCWIEGLRTDSLYLGAIRVSQLVAGVCFIAFVIAFILRRIRCKPGDNIKVVEKGE